MSHQKGLLHPSPCWRNPKRWSPPFERMEGASSHLPLAHQPPLGCCGSRGPHHGVHGTTLDLNQGESEGDLENGRGIWLTPCRHTPAANWPWHLEPGPGLGASAGCRVNGCSRGSKRHRWPQENCCGRRDFHAGGVCDSLQAAHGVVCTHSAGGWDKKSLVLLPRGLWDWEQHRTPGIDWEEHPAGTGQSGKLLTAVGKENAGNTGKPGLCLVHQRPVWAHCPNWTLSLQSSGMLVRILSPLP